MAMICIEDTKNIIGVKQVVCSVTYWAQTCCNCNLVSFMLHTSWCSLGDSSTFLFFLSGGCTWGLWGTSCRCWIVFTEIMLKGFPPLNLMINNGGFVVHLRWHSGNNMGMVSLIVIPSMKINSLQRKYVGEMCSPWSIGLPLIDNYCV
jgi:hypothetical protein